MSAAANFLQIQYKLGRITAVQIQSLSGIRITQEETDLILGENNAATESNHGKRD